MFSCRLRPFASSLLCLSIVTGGGQAALSQITISFDDVRTSLTDSRWMAYTVDYYPEPFVDLGVFSPAGQTFDLAAIPNEDSRDSAVRSYVDPAGAAGSSYFPGATLCRPEVFRLNDTSEITRVAYFLLREDGLYMLGTYIRQVLSTVFDTTIVERHTPMELLLPLPLGYGTARTAVDTFVLDRSNNDFAVTSTTVSCDAWGDLLFPLQGSAVAAPSAVSCLRVIRTVSRSFFFEGTFAGSDDITGVEFITPEGARVAVAQDDPDYSEGAARVASIGYPVRLGASGVGPGTGGVPIRTALLQNYPNPFNPATTISFSVAETGPVRLEVFDLLGRRVSVLLDRVMPPGTHVVPFDAAALAAGMYAYRLTTADRVLVKKMNVVR